MLFPISQRGAGGACARSADGLSRGDTQPVRAVQPEEEEEAERRDARVGTAANLTAREPDSRQRRIVAVARTGTPSPAALTVSPRRVADAL